MFSLGPWRITACRALVLVGIRRKVQRKKDVHAHTSERSLLDLQDTPRLHLFSVLIPQQNGSSYRYTSSTPVLLGEAYLPSPCLICTCEVQTSLRLHQPLTQFYRFIDIKILPDIWGEIVISLKTAY